MENYLKDVIDILARETGDYVTPDNAAQVLEDLLSKKDSDLDDLKEGVETVLSGKCLPDDAIWEKWVMPNLFISWAYLQEIMRLGGAHEDKIALSDDPNDFDGVDDISGNPYEDQASDILDVSISEYREKYATNPRNALRRLRKIVDQINSSSNDN